MNTVARFTRERFGDFRVIHTRFSRWAKKGIWEEIFKVLSADSDNEYVMIDRTIVRGHQHSAGAKGSSAEQEDLGRSVGGLSTKIHTIVDALGNPVDFFDSWSEFRPHGSRCLVATNNGGSRFG